ncbi:MAG: hypothetical protein JST92_22140 [Deltaproteobacteria bacterium]|nr:hypothetical protein [Deltaproteobacteria bacterium]
MTIKFHESDDGTKVDGKTVVFLTIPPQTTGEGEQEKTPDAAPAAAGGDGPADASASGKPADGASPDGGVKLEDSKVAAKGPKGFKDDTKSQTFEADDKPKPLGPPLVMTPNLKESLAESQAKGLEAAAESGAPFCEECDRARREMAAAASA